MNERIKELERLATTVVEGWSDENGTTRYYEFNREKFAELIVKECVDTVSDCSVEYCTRPQIVSEIKLHFGVEE
jgi:hypothetical protein